MRRLHLFELQDQPWLPRALRDALTDLLRAEAEALGTYLPIVPRLLAALLRTRSHVIVDLCSGGGGPLLQIQEAIESQGSHVTVVLTDRFPNRAAFERARARGSERIEYRAAPVDARAVPPGLTGFRTLFSAFHHFREPDAIAILRDAVAQRAPIAVFEFTHRTPYAALGMLAGALRIWARPPPSFLTSRARFVLTRILPVLPALYYWDGLVSHFRTYSPSELRSLADAAGGTYRWTAGVERRDGSRITFLIGTPGNG